MKLKLYLLFMLLTCINCDGTLGGFSIISFSTSKANIEIAMDSLYSNYPKYKIPNKWDSYFPEEFS